VDFEKSWQSKDGQTNGQAAQIVVAVSYEAASFITTRFHHHAHKIPLLSINLATETGCAWAIRFFSPFTAASAWCSWQSAVLNTS
jgi:hypothetical protein